MEITNFDLVNIVNILNNFEDKKLPQKISYAITRNLMLLEKDNEIYTKQLFKIFQEYDSYFIKDNNGNPKVDKLGLPIIENIEINKEYQMQISDLLNIKIDVLMYHIDSDIFDEVFNYDDYDKKYDPISARDLTFLNNILCKPPKDKSNIEE